MLKILIANFYQKEMEMKFLVTFLLFGLFVPIGLAQEGVGNDSNNSSTPVLVNPENQWNEVSYSMFGDVSSRRYNFDSDIIFRNGNTYLELNISTDEMGSAWEGTGQYFRSTPNQVFEWIDDSDYLLYDFSLNVGDTFIVQETSEWPEAIELVVTAVDSITLMDQSKRKRLVLECENGVGEHIWVKGMGDLQGLLSVKKSCLLDVNENLLCFSFNEEVLYQDPDEGECWITTSTEDVERRELSIHPNPARDIVQISGLHPNEAINYTIFSNTGLIISSGKTRDHTLSVGTLPPGLYLLELHTQHQKVTKKFVKVD
jgi:hypothetical protein